MLRNVNLFIENLEVAGEGEKLCVVSPVTEAVVADFPGASVAQVDQAVQAARRAFESETWSDPNFRQLVLSRFADGLAAHKAELVEALLEEVGTPYTLNSANMDVTIDFVRWFANEAVKDRTRNLGPNKAGTATSLVAYRPVGVVAAITAFNYPIVIGATKAAAALAAGCTVVLLSSPLAPVAVSLLGKLVREAGFPAGVFNILAGGVEVGRALTEHPVVDKISFTGSVNVGRQVMMQAASGLRSVVLELGGKSAAILLPGVDFEKYVFPLHARYSRNAGQGCGSPTRILVEETRYEEFCEISREVFPRILVGDPRDPATIVGPVVSSVQRDRIEAAVQRTVAAGAEVIAGGGRPDIEKGWYLNPTLIGNIDNSADLARNEMFGPVAVVLTYKTVDEAIRIANDSELGLKAYLFGPTAECVRLAPRLRVGTVHINGGGPMRPEAPMSGYKNSGVGDEWGEDGLREFLLTQHIDVPIA